MTVTPEHESPRPARGGAFSDAVTVAFGDASADVYGIARVGLSRDARGEPVASGLGIMFSGGIPVAVRAAGGEPVAGDGWSGASVAGVRSVVVAPLERWTVAFADEAGANGFALDLVALSAPAAVDPLGEAAQLGGMEGYEQLVAVRGSATVAGEQRAIDCLGQRGHSWGAPDWERLTLARTVTAWVPDAGAVTLTAVRGEKAKSHGDEAISAFVFEPPAEGQDGPALPAAVADPRISTTYDADGCQRHVGLELWMGDEDDTGGWARRAAGEIVCGTTLDLGRLRLDCAFVHWRMEGREGVGRYDLLRRAND